MSPARLTPIERRDRETREEHLQAGIVDLATMLGWDWLHVRPGIRKPAPGGRSTWWTPTIGTLRWWPDLVLVRGRDRRLIFAELKRQLEEPSPDQEIVLWKLKALADYGDGGRPRIEVHVWRPSDLRDPLESSVVYGILR